MVEKKSFKQVLREYLDALYNQGIISYSHNYLRCCYNAYGEKKTDRALRLYFKLFDRRRCANRRLG